MSKIMQLFRYSITMVAILIALLTTGCMSEVDSAIKDSIEKKMEVGWLSYTQKLKTTMKKIK